MIARLRNQLSTHCSGAVVLGGDYKALGIVRSLGRHGIPVWVLKDAHAIAATSRYALRSLQFPEGSEAEQLAYLIDLWARQKLDGWVLFPGTDEAAALIARHAAELTEY